MNQVDAVSALQNQISIQQAESNSQHRQLNELRSQVANLTLQLQQANVREQQQLQPTLANQNSEIQSLRLQNSSLNLGIQALNERVQQEARNAMTLQQNAEEQRRAAEFEHQQLLRTQSDLNVASSVIHQLAFEKEQAVAAFRQSQEEFAKLTYSSNQISALSASKDEEIRRGREWFEKVQADFDRELLQATSTIGKNNQKISELTEEMMTLAAEKRGVEEMLNRVQADLNGLRETWNGVSSSKKIEIQQLKTELSASQERIESLQSEHVRKIQDLNEQLEKAKADLAASSERIDSLQAEHAEKIRNADQQLQWAHEEIEATRNLNFSLNTNSFSDSLTRIDELERQLFENERLAGLASEQAAAENRAKQQEIDQLKLELSAANQEVLENRQKVQAQLDELFVGQQTLFQSNQELRTEAQSRVLELDQTLRTKDAEIEALKKQLEEQRSAGQRTVDDLCSLYKATAQERDQMRSILTQLFPQGGYAAK